MAAEEAGSLTDSFAGLLACCWPSAGCWLLVFCAPIRVLSASVRLTMFQNKGCTRCRAEPFAGSIEVGTSRYGERGVWVYDHANLQCLIVLSRVHLIDARYIVVGTIDGLVTD